MVGSPLAYLHRDWAHARHICTGTGKPCHICAGTGLAPPHRTHALARSHTRTRTHARTCKRTCVRAEYPGWLLCCATPSTHARPHAQVTVVHGRAGSGKSALLAKITDDIKSSVKNGTTVSLFMRTVGHRRRRGRRRAPIGSQHALTGSGLRGLGPVRSLLREWSAAFARARALQGISTNAAYEYLAREVAPAERLRAGAEAREHFHEALRKAAEKKAATSSGAGALCVLTHTRIRAPGRALTHAHVRARTHARMKTRALPRICTRALCAGAC